MTDKNPFKKEYRSKKTVTKCGYCSLEVKEGNLENHCKTSLLLDREPLTAYSNPVWTPLLLQLHQLQRLLNHHHPPKKQSWLLKRELVITLMISWSPRLMIKTTTLLLCVCRFFFSPF